MVMVTGGAYQGKTKYVVQKLGIPEKDITDGSVCSADEAEKAVCIINYQELVRRLGDGCIEFTEKFCRCNGDAVIVINEIGCGIVPIEKAERVWRENVGRCGCIIAANSDKVIRMVCGIPSVIKGETE